VLKLLLYRPEHITATYDLALITQAIAEDLTFVTTESRIAQYASSRFRIPR
jgi:hypothetical protein